MAAATVLAYLRTGTAGSPTDASAETGIKWNRADLQNDTTPIPIPGSTGTNFSYIKSLGLNVTVAGTTNMSNRRVAFSGTMAQGLNYSFLAVALASYAQAVAPPTASGSNGQPAPGFALMTTSNQVYQASSNATSATGFNGGLCTVCLGVDATYGGGGGNANASPALSLVYDEA